MDVIARVIWWVKLDYPIYARDIETTRCYVCAEENARLGIDEFKKGIGAFLLLLLALLIPYE